MTMAVHIQRVYVPSSPADGKRILVDRLWPRGLSKDKANVDLWLKEIAPSNDLRKWFAHDPARWAEFQRRYKEELKANREPLAQLKLEAARGTVTLLYGAHDEKHNQAVVLAAMLRKR
jgi:uncharacterized protein YeaO (DUF488 family)